MTQSTSRSQEPIGCEEGAVVKDVPPALYMCEATDDLLNKLRRGLPGNCLESVRKLYAFVEEHPDPAIDYDEVRDRF